MPWRRDSLPTPVFLGFPDGSVSMESAYSAGDLGSIPGSERSPGEGEGYPLRYSCLENHHGQRRLLCPSGHKESDTTAQLSTAQYIHIIEYYSALEKKALLTYSITWTNFEDIVTEISQTPKTNTMRFQILCECTQCPWTVHLQMAKQWTLCAFYHKEYLK